MKSEKACDRKSRSTELPGPLPTTFDEAMAMLAWAVWASLSRSMSSGRTSSLSRNFTMRAFQVLARWNTFDLAETPGTLLSAVCSVMAIFFGPSFGIGSVAHKPHHGEDKHTSHGQHAQRLSQLHLRHTADEHHDEHREEEQGCRGKVLHADERKDGQRHITYILNARGRHRRRSA